MKYPNCIRANICGCSLAALAAPQSAETKSSQPNIVFSHNTGAPELRVRLPEAQIRFPELLREAGYYTGPAGKKHMLNANEVDRAFDEIATGGGPGGEEDWVEHVRERLLK